jgi:uncharacterized protein YnzC (UPF0291/DUF896 family)
MASLRTSTWKKQRAAYREEFFEVLRSNVANHLGNEAVAEQVRELEREEEAVVDDSPSYDFRQ